MFQPIKICSNYAAINAIPKAILKENDWIFVHAETIWRKFELLYSMHKENGKPNITKYEVKKRQNYFLLTLKIALTPFGYVTKSVIYPSPGYVFV